MMIPSPFADAAHLGDGPEAAALALADWLDEHGDPARARFVRLSSWLRLDPWAADALAQARERRWLWDVGRPEWRPPLPGGLEWAAGPDALGLPGAIRGTAVELGRHADEWTALGARAVSLTERPSPGELTGPWVTRLGGLSLRTADAEALSACLAEVADAGCRPRRMHLEVSPDARGHGDGAVFASPALGRVAELAVVCLPLRGLARYPALAGMRDLSCYWGGVNPGGACLTPCPELRSLFTEGDRPDDAVARPGLAPRLESTSLAMERYDVAGEWLATPTLRHARVLMREPSGGRGAVYSGLLASARGLVEVDAVTGIAGWDRHPLAEWDGLASVRTARLRGSLGPEMLGSFCVAPAACGVRSLGVTARSPLPEVLSALAGGVFRLEELTLQARDGEVDLARLAASPALAGLRSLVVGRPSLPATAAADWAERLPLEEVSVFLEEGHDPPDAAWAARIARCPALRRVTLVEFDFGEHPEAVPDGWLARGETIVRP